MTSGEVLVEQRPHEKVCLEKDAPLVESILWSMMQEYYKQMAVKAWAHNYVPMFVTSNSSFCRAYASIMFGAMRDIYAAGGTGPVYIIETGAGHGRFTYLVLRHLSRMKPLFAVNNFPERPYVYMFTDVAEANVHFAQNHSAMQDFIKEGVLDFAVFDCNVQDEIPTLELRVAGHPLPRGAPCIAVANYVFDSLLTDAFQISPSGEIRRSCVSVYSEQKEENLTDALSRITVSWKWHRIQWEESDDEEMTKCRHRLSIHIAQSSPEQSGVFGVPSPMQGENVLKRRVPPNDEEDEDCAGSVGMPEELKLAPIRCVIEHYRKLAMKQSSWFSFTFPLGAFRFLKALKKYSENNLLCIVGDKGFTHPCEFFQKKNPHMALHGSLSFMVNLHALCLLFCVDGGETIDTPYQDTFKVSLLSSTPLSSRPSCLQASSDTQGMLVVDTLLRIQKLFQDRAADHQFTLAQLLALVRVSHHDPDVFADVSLSLVELSVPPFMTKRNEYDIVKDCRLIYENWYKVSASENVPESLAHICMKTGRMEPALFYLMECLRWSPQSNHPATYVNIASCQKVLGRFAESEENIQKALEMQPGFKPAIEFLEYLNLAKNPVPIIFMGSGEFCRIESLPLLCGDYKTSTVGVYSQNAADLELMKAQCSKISSRPLEELSTFEQIVALKERMGILAAIVDLDDSETQDILPRLWSAGIHTLCKCPMAGTVEDARSLTKQYADICTDRARKGKYHVLWQQGCPLATEEVAQTVQKALVPHGTPMAVSIASTGNSIQALIGTLLRSYSTLRYLFPKLTLRSMSARGKVKADMSSPEEDIISGMSHMAGWIQANISRDGSITPLAVSFFLSLSGADATNRITLLFKGANVQIEVNHLIWKMSVDDGVKAPVVKAFPTVGMQNLQDQWLSQVHQAHSEIIPDSGEDAACENDSPEGTAMDAASEAPVSVHRTVEDAILESTLRSGLVTSIRHKGSVVNFK